MNHEPNMFSSLHCSSSMHASVCNPPQRRAARLMCVAGRKTGARSITDGVFLEH